MLRKGPKFIPATKGNLFSSKADIQNFTHKLIIREKFGNVPNNDESLLCNQSKRDFKANTSELAKIVDDLNNIDPGMISYQENISKNERAALSELQNNKNIVLKKADKGYSWVLMDTKYYREHLVMNGHLNTPSYTPIKSQ